MQKNRRFNAGKQFRRLPVYSFRVCRKIRELLPGKNATVPGGIMDAASPSREHGAAPHGGQRHTAGGRKAQPAARAPQAPAENTVLPPLPEPAQRRDTGMPAARRNARLPHDQGGSARTAPPIRCTVRFKTRRSV